VIHLIISSNGCINLKSVQLHYKNNKIVHFLPNIAKKKKEKKAEQLELKALLMGLVSFLNVTLPLYAPGVGTGR